MGKYLLLWSCSQMPSLDTREKKTEDKPTKTLINGGLKQVMVSKVIPAWCHKEHGCWETWPSHAPPTVASLSQTAAKNVIKSFIIKKELCFLLTVMSCIDILKFLTKKLVRSWCVTCLGSPWILSSRAERKQTGWWERPPGPLWRLSTTCVWTPGHFHELHPGSGGCDHHSDSRYVNWTEELHHVCREVSHQFLSVWLQGSFLV